MSLVHNEIMIRQYTEYRQTNKAKKTTCRIYWKMDVLIEISSLCPRVQQLVKKQKSLSLTRVAYVIDLTL